MAIRNKLKLGGTGVSTTHEIDTIAGDFAGLPNNTYFRTSEDSYSLPYWKDSTGILVSNFSSSAVLTGNTVYVMANGNDGTGVRGDFTKPFLTLEAGRDASLIGDLIHVYSGNYTVTTTDSSGLAKDGIEYYFEAGCIVTKATSGALFNLDGFTTKFNVFGYANFTTTFSGSEVWRWTSGSGFNSTFEGGDAIATSASVVLYKDMSQAVNFKLRHVISSSNHAFNFQNNASFKTPKIIIDAVIIQATANVAIITNKTYIGSSIDVRATLIESSANYAVQHNGTEAPMNITAGKVTGVASGKYSVYMLSTAQMTLNCTWCTGLNLGGTTITNVNGQVRYLLIATSAKANISYLSYEVIQTGGELITSMASMNTNVHHTPIITISGGLATIIGMRAFDNSAFIMTVSGGVLNMSGNWETKNDRYDRTISGTGVVICNANFTLSTSVSSQYKKPIFNLTGGKLIINSGARLNILGPASESSAIYWSGGELISNGATILTANVNAPPIISESASQDLLVYAGGLTTNRPENGGTLSAKKQGWTETVDSVATTSITINDGTGGDEVFTEADTVTYNTVDLLASRMASLINGSGTLDVTATYVSGDTFEWESSIAGNPITRVTDTNLSFVILRLNSYLMADILASAVIIDNSNVS